MVELPHPTAPPQFTAHIDTCRDEATDDPSSAFRPTPITYLSDSIYSLLDHFHSLALTSAPTVERAVLAPIWALGDAVNVPGAPGNGKTILATDIIISAASDKRTCTPFRLGCRRTLTCVSTPWKVQ